MRTISRLFRAGLLTLVAASPFVCGGCGCGPNNGIGAAPPRSPADYAAIVSVFTIGTLGLETNDPNHQEAYLTKMTQMAPEEPAGWGNLALYQMSNTRLKEAGDSLARATSEAPNNGEIEKLQGLLADRNGDLPGAIRHYQRAAELAPNDVRVLFSLAEIQQRQGTPEGDAAYQAALEKILERQPYNLVAQVRLAQVAAKRGDFATVRAMVDRLKARASSFDARSLGWLDKLKTAAAASDARSTALNASFLLNVLTTNIAYHQSASALQKDPKEGYSPIRQFIKLPPIPALPAEPDAGLTFQEAPLLPAGSYAAAWAGASWLDDSGAQALLVADGKTARLDSGAALPFPGGPAAKAPGPHGILDLDMNYDLKNDLVFAGAGGVRFYQQGARGVFADVTGRTRLPSVVLTAAYTGAWSADIEADGDLDIVMGSAAGAPLVLRNNGDGTWAPIHPFASVSGVTDFAWLDIDGDGSADAAILDGDGKLHLFANLRAGIFRERTLPSGIGEVRALAVADVNADGRLDLLALKTDGSILRISDKDRGTDFEVAPLAHWPGSPPKIKPGTARLAVADLDNNGGIDLIASALGVTRVWLCDQKREYAALEPPMKALALAQADLDKDGRIDLVGVTTAGKAVRLINKGTKSYSWQELRLHAKADEVAGHANAIKDRQAGSTSDKTGDAPVNPFGIGGEIEARAGLLYQKQAVTSPVVHIGLGSSPHLDAVRIVWPNGDVRAEFGDTMKPDASVSIEHRLTGSCPWIFAWNGKAMGFVTDFIWRSPLGLRINAQDTAGTEQTEDWVKIRGDQLAPRDGYYDVRITAELWETHFFDYVRLMTVDHPENTEIYVDERFSRTPPKLQVHAFAPPIPVARAVDDHGADVTDIVHAVDGRYLDTFGRGAYQGITRDHYVEVELAPTAGPGGPLYLIASGWIHPTDSSINVAISQGKHDPPRGLSLEIPDGRGGWRTAKADLGFPAGKTKTVLIRLDDIAWPNSEPKRLRLRTNLEIYWDALSSAVELPSTSFHSDRLPLQSAELRYRGYSTLNKADASSPELPDYERLSGIGPKWRDLIGYCTRFGDVRPLLERVDDSYVIMNAGDELAMRFPERPAPARGFKRDYVLIGDGWEKDGNLNTAYSKTILPLPYHGQKHYNTPPGRLEDDPAYRRHPRDWQVYHTRFISPEGFQSAFRPGN